MMFSVFHRYEIDPKLAIYWGSILAAHRGRKCIEPDDLLLGLTWRVHAADCPFRALKNDSERLWAAAGMPHLPISRMPYSPIKLPLSRSAKDLLRSMREEADRSGDHWIDIDHMISAILRQGGASANALSECGWTLEGTRMFGQQARIKSPPKIVTRAARYKTSIDKYVQPDLFWRAFWVGVALAGVAIILFLRFQN